eukprot:37607-Amphidinium_carterae.1
MFSWTCNLWTSLIPFIKLMLRAKVYCMAQIGPVQMSSQIEDEPNRWTSGTLCSPIQSEQK